MPLFSAYTNDDRSFLQTTDISPCYVNMGIPGLYKEWLRRQNVIANSMGASLVDLQPGERICLAFDLNTLIHQTAQWVFGYGDWKDTGRGAGVTEAAGVEELLKAITARLVSILDSLGYGKRPLEEEPIKALILSVDGVVPAAKTYQQRQRRFMSAKEGRTSVFNKNVITPGTDFMRRLHDHLVNFISEDRHPPNPQYRLPELVVYSSHLDPGEGEHKLFKLLRDPRLGTIDRYIIWGKDADLVILSIMVTKLTFVIHSDIRGNPKVHNLETSVNVDLVKRDLAKYIGNSNIGLNFALLMCFIGNDFIPKLPTMQPIDAAISLLLRLAREIRGSGDLNLVTDQAEIHWTNFSKYIERLNDATGPDVWNAAMRTNVKYQFVPLQQYLVGGEPAPISKLDDVPGADEEEKLLNLADNWYLYYTSYVNSDYMARFLQQAILPSTSEVVEKMVDNYLTAMSWVVLYYSSSGEATNNDWYYPHFVAPLLPELSDFSVSRAAAPEAYIAYKSNKRLEGEYFSPYMQLVSVLPESEIRIVPQDIRVLFTMEGNLFDYMVKDFRIENGGSDFEHTNMAIIPFVDRERIASSVNSLGIEQPPPAPAIFLELSAAARKERDAKILGRAMRPPQRELYRTKTEKRREPRSVLPPGERYEAVPTRHQATKRPPSRTQQPRYAEKPPEAPRTRPQPSYVEKPPVEEPRTKPRYVEKAPQPSYVEKPPVEEPRTKPRYVEKPPVEVPQTPAVLEAELLGPQQPAQLSSVSSLISAQPIQEGLWVRKE
jgi:hypothetical protein